MQGEVLQVNASTGRGERGGGSVHFFTHRFESGEADLAADLGIREGPHDRSGKRRFATFREFHWKVGGRAIGCESERGLEVAEVPGIEFHIQPFA